MPFIGKAHSDPIIAESPNLLNEPIIELAIPFSGEECFDLLAPMNKLGAVPPNAVSGIGECYSTGVAGIPGVLGKACLLCGGLCAEGRKWRTAHGLTSFLFERLRCPRLAEVMECSKSVYSRPPGGHRQLKHVRSPLLGSMSAMGQNPTCAVQNVMSAWCQ